jgi:hypothetical protein
MHRETTDDGQIPGATEAEPKKDVVGSDDTEPASNNAEPCIEQGKEKDKEKEKEQEKPTRALPDWMQEKKAAQEVRFILDTPHSRRKKIPFKEKDRKKSPLLRKLAKLLRLQPRAGLQREVGHSRKSMIQPTYHQVRGRFPFRDRHRSHHLL